MGFELPALRACERNFASWPFIRHVHWSLSLVFRQRLASGDGAIDDLPKLLPRNPTSEPGPCITPFRESSSTLRSGPLSGLKGVTVGEAPRAINQTEFPTLYLFHQTRKRIPGHAVVLG